MTFFTVLAVKVKNMTRMCVKFLQHTEHAVNKFTATVKYYTKQNVQNQSLEQIHSMKRSRCEIISRRIKIFTPCYYKHHSELNHCTLSPNQASVAKSAQITATEVKSLQSVLNI